MKSNHLAGYVRISDSTFLPNVKYLTIFYPDICTNKKGGTMSCIFITGAADSLSQIHKL
nr:hypothetical protein [Mucilaginibacter sp. X5P1]